MFQVERMGSKRVVTCQVRPDSLAEELDQLYRERGKRVEKERTQLIESTDLMNQDRGSNRVNINHHISCHIFWK